MGDPACAEKGRASFRFHSRNGQLPEPSIVPKAESTFARKPRRRVQLVPSPVRTQLMGPVESHCRGTTLTYTTSMKPVVSQGPASRGSVPPTAHSASKSGAECRGVIEPDAAKLPRPQGAFALSTTGRSPRDAHRAAQTSGRKAKLSRGGETRSATARKNRFVGMRAGS